MGNKKPWINDCLERQEVAELLTAYIDDANHVNVVNINSPWGTGKTFFLTNWRDDLMRERAVVYFNAWENDYTGDPMISIVANIRDQLRELVPPTAAVKGKLQSLLKTASAAVVSTTPVILKGVTKKLTGVVVDEVAASLEEKDIETVEGAAEKFVERLIESNADRLESVNAFKKSLSSLVGVATKKSGKPLYVFIDELDRCRPTYAIELLERVKHIFDIEGCKFIVATDTAQLSHSVSVVYGHSFSSVEYLKRFFDLTYSFGVPNIESWVKSRIAWEVEDKLKIVSRYDIRGYHPQRERVKAPDARTVLREDLSHAQLIFLLLSNMFGLDLRKLERLREMLELLVGRCAKQNMHFFYLAYLAFLYHADENEFNTLCEGKYKSVPDTVREKYHSHSKLYFKTCSLDLHAIASDYLLHQFGDDKDIRLQSSSDMQPEYFFELTRTKDNGTLRLEQYPHLVKLAMRVG